jgi:hypothetical protein
MRERFKRAFTIARWGKSEGMNSIMQRMCPFARITYWPNASLRAENYKRPHSSGVSRNDADKKLKRSIIIPVG